MTYRALVISYCSKTIRATNLYLTISQRTSTSVTKGAVTRGNVFLQRNGVSSCLLQEKLPPVTLLVCKIIRLQVIQQFAYVYNSTGT